MSLYSVAQNPEAMIEIADLPANLPIIMLDSMPEFITPEEFGMEHDVQDVHEPVEIEIVVYDLPGVQELDPEREKQLKVKEEPSDSNDLAESKKSNKDPKWDAPKGKEFIAWIKSKINNDVPLHTGYDTLGVDRAIAFFERLEDEAARTMRTDINGDLDINEVIDVRTDIEKKIDLLRERNALLEKNSKKKKKKAEYDQNGLVKEAQKAMNVSGIVITVDLFISRIARVCINSTISAGRDLESTYHDQVKEWDLDKREQAQVQQLLADFGYPIRQDRGFIPGENVDPTSEDNYDWQSIVQA